MEVANGLATDSQGRAYLSGARQIFDLAADVRARVVRHLDATGCAPGEQPPGPPAPPSEPPATGGGGAGGGAALAPSRRASAVPCAQPPTRARRSTQAGSTGATGYRWDVNGDGRDDVACGASEPPLLTTRMSATTRAASTTVRTNRRGQRRRDLDDLAGGRRGVELDGSAPRHQRRPAAGLRAKRDTHRRLASSCTPETLDFGAVSAAGCFERVDDRAGVPKGELPILDAAIAYFNRTSAPSVRRQIVHRGVSGKCTVKAASSPGPRSILC